MSAADSQSQSRSISRFRRGSGKRPDKDAVTVEEPLEIRVDGRSIAVVMRTPGDDLDLTRGFLLTEGIVKEPGDIFELSQCPSQDDPEELGNVVDVLLTAPDSVDLDALSRNVYTSSSCGLCGRATIASIHQQYPEIRNRSVVSANVLLSLSDTLRQAQQTFAKTGGLHASALFDFEGHLLDAREDVGRHNALDKLIGARWANGEVPLSDRILLVSGRVSFELTQKAWCAGIPIVAGISAPSTLAVDTAATAGQTLVGFLREETMNLYTWAQRIEG